MAACAALALALVASTAHAGTPTGGVQAELLGTFDQPTHIAAAPGRPRYLYVTERSGVVRVLRAGVARPKPVLDIADLVAEAGEQGLLSIAFAPDFRQSRRFYLFYTADSHCSGTNGCPIRVDEFKTRRRNPERARRSSRRRVIRIPHRTGTTHNGATAAFGPDGKLWIATGDGGGIGDQHQNARDRGTLLGKLLRINPLPRRPAERGYRIPRTNPFVGLPGRNEVWSYGLRNPFRFSFDQELNTIAIGDVGQGTEEEVTIVPVAKARGAGFGWPEWEGNFDYPEAPPYTPPWAQLFPIFTYPNPETGPSAVTGGLIAHDPQLPQLEGRYLVADFFAGQIMTFVPDLAANEADDVQPLDVDPIPRAVAFGAGLDGQLYVVSLSGPIYRLEPE